jgi:hypothetical protein
VPTKAAEWEREAFDSFFKKSNLFMCLVNVNPLWVDSHTVQWVTSNYCH